MKSRGETRRAAVSLVHTDQLEGTLHRGVHSGRAVQLSLASKCAVFRVSEETIGRQILEVKKGDCTSTGVICKSGT